MNSPSSEVKQVFPLLFHKFQSIVTCTCIPGSTAKFLSLCFVTCLHPKSGIHCKNLRSHCLQTSWKGNVLFWAVRTQFQSRAQPLLFLPSVPVSPSCREWASNHIDNFLVYAPKYEIIERDSDTENKPSTCPPHLHCGSQNNVVHPCSAWRREAGG